MLAGAGMLEELEDALHYNIFTCLCIHDLQALRCVSKSYLSLIESDAVWHVLLESLHYWKGVNTRALKSPTAKEVSSSEPLTRWCLKMKGTPRTTCRMFLYVGGRHMLP